MSHAPTDSARPSGARRLADPPPGFLVRIALAIGTRLRATDDYVDSPGDGEVTGAWHHALERRCREVSLRAHVVEIASADLPGLVGPRSALSCWDEQAGWVAIVSDGAGRARLIGEGTSASALSPTRLIARFGSGDHASREWVVIEPTLSEATSPKAGKLSPARRLVELVRPDRADIGTIVLYAVFVGLLSLATPIAVQQLVTSVAFGGLVQPVVVLALMLVVGLGFAALLSTLQAYVVEMIQRRVFVRTCVDLAERLPRVAPDAFSVRHGPEVVNRFFDVVTLQKTGASLLLAGTALLLQTFTGLMILSLYHPLMFGFSLVLILAIAFVVGVLGRGGTRTAIAESSAKYELAGWMEEIVRAPSLFRSRAGRRHASRRADSLAASWVDAREHHFRIVLRQIIASLGLQVLANASVLALGGFLVVSGQLTLGQLVASEIIVAAVVAAFARLGKLLESYYDLLAAVDEVGILLDLPLERAGGDVPEPSNGPAVVDVRGVDLPGAAAPFSMRVEAGQRVGLSGPSGTGKSALLDLVGGLRAPNLGSVFIDGEHLGLLRLESLRDQVMMLRQPEFHAASLIDNVRVVRPSAAPSEIESALERVGLKPVIEALPEGLLTRIDASGRPLGSGHARQLMLARALVARPRLLLVDDEVTHVDPAARAAMLEVAFDPDASWSVIVATHDPAWLERCDALVTLRGVADEAATASLDSGADAHARLHSTPARGEEPAA